MRSDIDGGGGVQWGCTLTVRRLQMAASASLLPSVFPFWVMASFEVVLFPVFSSFLKKLKTRVDLSERHRSVVALAGVLWAEKHGMWCSEWQLCSPVAGFVPSSVFRNTVYALKVVPAVAR